LQRIRVMVTGCWCARILCAIQCLFWKLHYMIYLLTAVGLSPGGSAHLHTNNT
jgi:hypothetical protein